MPGRGARADGGQETSSPLPHSHPNLSTCNPTQQGVRRLSYQGLLAVLPRLAEARGCTVAEVVRRLLACEGPTRTATTTPENVRLSDRSNFCGARFCWAMDAGLEGGVLTPSALRLACLPASAMYPLLTQLAHFTFAATGVAARGGPSVVEKRITLEAAVDRSGRRTALAPVE